MARFAALVLLLAAAAACSHRSAPEAGPAPATPRLEIYDVRDLLAGSAAGADPVFSGPEALRSWAERVVVRSCWSEGVPTAEVRDGGVLVVSAHPDAHARLAGELAALRSSLHGGE